jgi:hypothetical protein
VVDARYDNRLRSWPPLAYQTADASWSLDSYDGRKVTSCQPATRCLPPGRDGWSLPLRSQTAVAPRCWILSITTHMPEGIESVWIDGVGRQGPMPQEGRL